MKYEPIIGLEIHVQLKTKSKMFCRCSADIWTEAPNTHVCPVCLGLPGALPFPNREAIEKVVKVALALNCKPKQESKFDRKNYFYPDLPKGFQISQYDLPFSEKGWIKIEVDDKKKKIGIIRAHLEEDTGKLLHTKNETLIDFNRSGIPLIEIVSAPEIKSAQEAKNYAVKIQQIIRYLGASDADMEKGSMRVEPNVSLRVSGGKGLPFYKVELKNINSFRSVEKAIEYEFKRQAEILGSGKVPIQETRGWNEWKVKTYSQRTKELAQDYRYFPEPDLTPMHLAKQLIANLQTQLPELPDVRRQRFIKAFGLSDYDANILTRDAKIAQFFESATAAFAQTRVKGIKAKVGKSEAQKAANWIKGEILRNLNELGKGILEINFLPADLAEIIYLADIGDITAQSAKLVLGKWMKDGVKPASLIESLQIKTLSEDEFIRVVKKVISENPKAVADFAAGKDQVLSFLIGQVQRATGGKLPSGEISAELQRQLKNSKN